ncbi:MAG: hypothetical protein KJZ83_13590 [Burkholderiaceae bacterium]|nr:hypothetical protein [Burkholderiaceae bacterium]
MTRIEVVTTPDEQQLRKVALLDYLLHIAGLLLSMGILSMVALIINYVKRDDANGTIYRSHMDWMIATFWWTLFWLVIALIPALLSFGLLSFLFLVPCLWFLYRMVKGLLRLLDGRPVP